MCLCVVVQSVCRPRNGFFHLGHIVLASQTINLHIPLAIKLAKLQHFAKCIQVLQMHWMASRYWWPFVPNNRQCTFIKDSWPVTTGCVGFFCVRLFAYLGPALQLVIMFCFPLQYPKSTTSPLLRGEYIFQLTALLFCRGHGQKRQRTEEVPIAWCCGTRCTQRIKHSNMIHHTSRPSHSTSVRWAIFPSVCPQLCPFRCLTTPATSWRILGCIAYRMSLRGTRSTSPWDGPFPPSKGNPSNLWKDHPPTQQWSHQPPYPPQAIPSVKNILLMQILSQKNCCILSYGLECTKSKHTVSTPEPMPSGTLARDADLCSGFNLHICRQDLAQKQQQAASRNAYHLHVVTKSIPSPISSSYITPSPRYTTMNMLAFLSMANWMPLANLSPSSWSLRMISAIKRSATFLKPASSLNLCRRWRDGRWVSSGAFNIGHSCSPNFAKFIHKLLVDSRLTYNVSNLHILYIQRIISMYIYIDMYTCVCV